MKINKFKISTALLGFMFGCALTSSSIHPYGERLSIDEKEDIESYIDEGKVLDSVFTPHKHILIYSGDGAVLRECEKNVGYIDNYLLNGRPYIYVTSQDGEILMNAKSDFTMSELYVQSIEDEAELRWAEDLQIQDEARRKLRCKLY